MTRTIIAIIIIYALVVLFLFAASRLFADSRAGKYSRHALNIVTAGLPALAMTGLRALAAWWKGFEGE